MSNQRANIAHIIQKNRYVFSKVIFNGYICNI